MKQCQCGAEYSPAEWARLELVGVQQVAGHPDVELRNCARCRSTLAIELAPSPKRRRKPRKSPVVQAGPPSTTGVYRVSREVYDRVPRVNWSRLKLVGKSLSHYCASLLQPQQQDTDARKRGRVGHVAVFEPELYASRCVVYPDRRAGPDWQHFADTHRDCEILTPAMDEQARAIACAVRANAAAIPYLSHGKAEQSVLWTHSVPGSDGYSIDCKGRVDFVTEADLVDMKTTRDASLFGFPREVLRYSMHAQAAMYLDGYAAATGRELGFVIVAVEVAPPFACTVFRLPSDVLNLGREIYRGYLERLHYAQTGNHWPAYAETETTLALPSWDGADTPTEADPTGLGLDIGG